MSPRRRGEALGLLVGVLLASCTDDQANVAAPCIASPDTVFEINRDSLRLVVGAEDFLYASASTEGCPYPDFIEAVGAQWTIRDSSVVVWADTLSRHLVGRSPGSSVVVVQWTTRADSLLVTVPDTFPMGPIATVAAGSSASCAVELSQALRCWGEGTSLLGSPTATGAIGSCRGSPCSPMPVGIAGGVHSVQVGDQHACTLNTAHVARCWGSNFRGQLGIGTYSEVAHVPAAVTGGVAFVSIALGREHTCGVSTDGTGFCWGGAESGKLGTGQQSMSAAVPTQVAGSYRFVAISARDESTCAVTTAGAIVCWGQLGAVSSTVAGSEQCSYAGKGGPLIYPCATRPLRMALSSTSADTLFAQISGMCGLTTQGSVYCWDASLGAFAERAGFGPFEALATGSDGGCGLDAGGAAWCWGIQTGDGTNAHHDQPVPVAGGHVFQNIARGSSHTCGVTTGQDVWCWGGNYFGQAGVPLREDTRSPRRVRGQG